MASETSHNSTTRRCTCSRSTVQTLYGSDVAAISRNQSQPVQIELQRSSEPQQHSVSIDSIRGTLVELNQRSMDSDIHRPLGRSMSSIESSFGSGVWIRVGGQLRGNGYTLRVRSHHNNLHNREPVAHVREENPSPYLEELKDTSFQEISHSDVHPMFKVDVDTLGGFLHPNGVILQLSFSAREDEDVDYVILQQETGSTQWSNITNECTNMQDTQNINIPVKKSSRIWVVRLKRLLRNALLALIHGRVLYHILVCYRVFKSTKEIKVRIIGISQGLYLSQCRKTAVQIACENEFVKGIEDPPKELLKKGKLRVELFKSDEIADCLGEFDLGIKDTGCNWFDGSLDVNELGTSLEVKIIDEEGSEQWNIDLNKILCEDESFKQVEYTMNCLVKPEISSFDEEITQHHIPWLSQQLNRDVDKVAMLLGCNLNDIDGIKQGLPTGLGNIKVLSVWREAECNRGKAPKWEKITTILESYNVRRFDIVRILLNEKEAVPNEALLWLAKKIAPDFEKFVLLLNVPDCEIKNAASTAEGCENKCFAVLRRWRQRTRSPTVDDLVQALQHPVMERNDLAESMRREEFCTSVTSGL